MRKSLIHAHAQNAQLERDHLLSVIANDVQSQAASHPYLARRSRPGKTNPLRPLKAADSRSNNDDGGDSSSSNEDADPKGKQARRSRLAQPLKIRRAIFERVDRLAEQERSRIKQAASPEKPPRNVNRPVDRSSAGSLSAEPLSSPAIMLSPSEENEGQAQQSQPPTRDAGRVSLAVDTSVSNSASPDPIKLLSPHQLRSLSSELAELQIRHEQQLSIADTHLECLTRLLYVFAISDKRWTYAENLVEIARVLYVVFASGGDVESFVTRGPGSKATSPPKRGSVELPVQDARVVNQWSRHAEAETFRALSALVDDLGDVIGLAAEDVESETSTPRDLGWAMNSFRRRLRWADHTLHDALASISLAPTSAEYGRRWIGALFAADLRIDFVLSLWDFILSEPPANAQGSPRADVAVDIGTAMIVLLKGRLMGLPGAGRSERSQTMWSAGEAADVFTGAPSFSQAHAALNDYPMTRIGVHEVLRVAWEIRQRQALAALGGSSPDAANEAAGQGGISNILSRATTTIRQRLPPANIDYDQIRSSLNANAASLQDSDAAAKVFKVSSNLTAAALARWNTTRQASGKTSGDWSSWTSSASKWLATGATESKADQNDPTSPPMDDKFTPLPPRTASPSQHSRRQSMASEVAAEVAEAADGVGAMDDKLRAGANLYRRDTNLPPSFISPRGSIVYPAGKYRPRQQRQTDGQTGGGNSLQSRLSALAATAAADLPPVPALPPSVSPKVKPLILSGSARPASPQAPFHSANSNRDSGSASPPGSVTSLNLDAGFGARRISIGSRHESPVAPSSKRASADAAASRGGLKRNNVESTSARLRAATGHVRRATDGGDSPATPQRYNLTDPGAKQADGPAIAAADTPSRSESPSSQFTEEDGVRKYRLTDAPTPQQTHSEASENLHRSDSGGSQHSVNSGLAMTRRAGVKKSKFAGRRNGSIGGESNTKRGSRQSVELSLPSPLPEESAAEQQQQQQPRPSMTRASTAASTGDDDDRESIAAKDGYGDLLESYASLGDI